MSDPVREVAPAKLNLALEILGRRGDGYHELVTLFQTIDLADRLELWRSDGLALECDDPSLAGQDNLALRAAEALRQRAGMRGGARIVLNKRIPIAAGLGGGSADAAATLRGLRSLWDLSVEDGELAEIARGLGADVPFLLRGGRSLATGVGDELEWLPDTPTFWAVVHMPESTLPNKTARAYRELASVDWTDGSATRRVADALARGDVGPLSEAPNAFARVADRLFPGLAAARRRLLNAGAPWVRLTGAGPSLFTLVETRHRAEAIRDALREPSRTWAVATSTTTVDRAALLH